MKTFQKIDPLSIANNASVVVDMVDNCEGTIHYYILLDQGYIIIAVCEWFTNKKTKQSKWITYQLEMPKSGLPWIVNTLVNKFLKLSHEGGLPADVRHYEEIVDGEKLGVSRAMSLGSKDHRESGYNIITLSRPEPGTTIGKELSFTDSFLFEHGFFDLLKISAEKISKGEL